jgi:prolyl-tRNA synthetase
MKQSNLYMPTTKDVSSQAVATSHILSVKAGLIHQTAAGMYSYLPLAVMMIQNVEKIIREELENIDANEVILPLLEPAHLWEATGRWQSYGDELFRVTDRKGTQFALAPTHEEVIVDLVSGYLNSYKRLPLNLYQIGTKMRDELRPRFGLLRGREFVMMDGYSFHADNDSLDSTYNDYFKAYCKIFERIGLEFKSVSADNGQMGGTNSHEFMALASIGEDTIVYEKDLDEAYNIEVAPVYYEVKNIDMSNAKDVSVFETIGVKTIDELSAKYSYNATDILKSVLFDVDGQLVMAVVRGDREVNDVKVLKAVGGLAIDFASNELISQFGLTPGYVGPYNAPEGVVVILDQEIQDMFDVVCGANEENYHVMNVSYTRDLSSHKIADIRNIEVGDLMRADGQPVLFAEGIEVGHIFALGDRYTKDLNVEFLTKEQKKKTPVMGCYGIGVSRLISAIIEQSHDENGIIMPKSISPFDVHLIPLDYNKKPEQKEFTDKIYEELKACGLKVLLDDRDERPGVKFSEADLIGLPHQIVVGRMFSEGVVEVKTRSTNEKVEVNVGELKAVLGV